MCASVGRSGGDERYLLGLVSLNIVYVYKNPARNVHISKLDSGTHDIEHTASRYGNLSSVSCAYVDDLLNAMNV